MAAEIIRITFKNGAYIDMQSRNAYDCAGQQATKLSEKPLEVLRCIAEHTITASDGTLTSDISTAEIFKLCWTKDVQPAESPYSSLTNPKMPFDDLSRKSFHGYPSAV